MPFLGIPCLSQYTTEPSNLNLVFFNSRKRKICSLIFPIEASEALRSSFLISFPLQIEKEPQKRPLSRKRASIVAGKNRGHVAPATEQRGHFGALLFWLPVADINDKVIDPQL